MKFIESITEYHSTSDARKRGYQVAARRTALPYDCWCKTEPFLCVYADGQCVTKQHSLTVAQSLSYECPCLLSQSSLSLLRRWKAL